MSDIVGYMIGPRLIGLIYPYGVTCALHASPCLSGTSHCHIDVVRNRCHIPQSGDCVHKDTAFKVQE